MHIGIVNEATRFSAHDCRAAVAAVAHQLRYDVAPAWDRHVPSIAEYPTLLQVPEGAHIIVIIDDTDVADTLGYHDETPDGRPYARVFVNPVLDNGGTALSGSLSVSAVLSHEVVELFGDPQVNLWADNWPRNEQVAVELCDPVEADSYDVHTRYGYVSVSDFVYPAWFDAQARRDTRFNHSWSDGAMTKPFSMTEGGYMLVRSEGQVTQRWADSDAPFTEQRLALDQATKLHPASRTWLRRNLTTGA